MNVTTASAWFKTKLSVYTIKFVLENFRAIDELLVIQFNKVIVQQFLLTSNDKETERAFLE